MCSVGEYTDSDLPETLLLSLSDADVHLDRSLLSWLLGGRLEQASDELDSISGGMSREGTVDGLWT